MCFREEEEEETDQGLEKESQGASFHLADVFHHEPLTLAVQVRQSEASSEGLEDSLVV